MQDESDSYDHRKKYPHINILAYFSVFIFAGILGGLILMSQNLNLTNQASTIDGKACAFIRSDTKKLTYGKCRIASSYKCRIGVPNDTGCPVPYRCYEEPAFSKSCTLVDWSKVSPSPTHPPISPYCRIAFFEVDNNSTNCQNTFRQYVVHCTDGRQSDIVKQSCTSVNALFNEAVRFCSLCQVNYPSIAPPPITVTPPILCTPPPCPKVANNSYPYKCGSPNGCPGGCGTVCLNQ